jgi:drug/metabolite transporter (DMT)-like permease
MSKTVQASLAAALASISFGASVVVTRYLISDMEPLLLAFLRFLIASLCLAPIFLLGARERLRAFDVAAILGLGVVFFGLFPWLFGASLQFIAASRGALWLATMPLLTLILAALLGFEFITRFKVAGIVLTGLGVALAVGGSGAPENGATWRGDLLMFATSCCGAIYFVLSRPFLRRLPAMQVTWISMVAGTAFLGGINALVGALPFPEMDVRTWAGVAFLGTFGGALGFFLWVWALRHSTPTRTAVFATLNPICAALLGVLLLGEPLTVSFVAGLVCALAGIVTANLSTRGPDQARA